MPSCAAGTPANAVAPGPIDLLSRGESNDELGRDGATECEATALGRGALAPGIAAADFDTGGGGITFSLNDDLGSSVDMAACSSCAFRRFLNSSSLISLSSSTSVLPLMSRSRTYASASSASRLLSCTFLARSSDWPASPSSNSVSTIQLTDAPSVRCTERSWAISRSTSKRVRGSHGGRSSGGLSSVRG